MPTYTYRCTHCRSLFERQHQMSDKPMQTCPACFGPVRRVPHPVGLLLKGAGFYCTDSRAHQSSPPNISAATTVEPQAG